MTSHRFIVVVNFHSGDPDVIRTRNLLISERKDTKKFSEGPKLQTLPAAKRMPGERKEPQFSVSGVSNGFNSISGAGGVNINDRSTSTRPGSLGTRGQVFQRERYRQAITS